MDTDMLDLTDEQKKRKELLNALKNKFAHLFQIKSEMLTSEEDFLMALYLTHLGPIQHEAFCLKTEIAILKRKTELLRSYIHKNQRPDLKNINIRIELEFIEYHKIIRDHSEQLGTAAEYSRSILSDQDLESIKTLYREIVKRIHPEINPHVSLREKQLFEQARMSYLAHDLAALRQIWEQILLLPGNFTVTFPAETTLQIARLQESISKIRAQIKQLNERFPFTYRERLQDDAWLSLTRKELEADVIALQQEKRRCQTTVILLIEWQPACSN